MPIIQKESGIEDLLLRPLCAKNLPETLPEREGWVDREKLLDFHGRNRKPQMALARSFGIEDYAQPAGGCCFLTDASYSAKLADLWKARGDRDYDLDDIMLLKVGRHLRPRAHFKLVVAREEGEVKFLRGYRRQFTHLLPTSHPGPLALLDGTAEADDLELAARIVARYSQGRDADVVSVEVVPVGGEAQTLEVAPLASDAIPDGWYV